MPARGGRGPRVNFVIEGMGLGAASVGGVLQKEFGRGEPM